MGLPILFARKKKFNPRQLFAAGEQGVWYDPSDWTTLFQDSAGTTPVTAIEQPVGLMLDKSGRGNHASQSTTTSRPILKQDETERYYLAFDGVDDWLQTANIDFSATDKVSVFAGVRKLSDAGGGVVVEQDYASLSTTTRLFSLFAPNGALANYAAGVSGETLAVGSEYCVGRATTYSAPTTDVLAAFYDGNGVTYSDKVQLRVDAITKTLDFTNSSGTLSTGTFGNLALFIGSRSGTGARFNGRLYSLLICGALTSPPQFEQTEKWVAGKTGVTL